MAAVETKVVSSAYRQQGLPRPRRVVSQIRTAASGTSTTVTQSAGGRLSPKQSFRGRHTARGVSRHYRQGYTGLSGWDIAPRGTIIASYCQKCQRPTFRGRYARGTRSTIRGRYHYDGCGFGTFTYSQLTPPVPRW